MPGPFLTFDFGLFKNSPILPSFKLNRIVEQPSLAPPTPSYSSDESNFFRSNPTTIADFHLNKYFREHFRGTTADEYEAFKRLNQSSPHPNKYYLSGTSKRLAPYAGVYLNTPSVYTMIAKDREVQKTKLASTASSDTH